MSDCVAYFAAVYGKVSHGFKSIGLLGQGVSKKYLRLTFTACHCIVTAFYLFSVCHYKVTCKVLLFLRCSRLQCTAWQHL